MFEAGKGPRRVVASSFLASLFKRCLSSDDERDLVVGDKGGLAATPTLGFRRDAVWISDDLRAPC